MEEELKLCWPPAQAGIAIDNVGLKDFDSTVAIWEHL